MPRAGSVRKVERFRELIGDFSSSEKFNGFGPATRKWVLHVLRYAEKVLGDIPTAQVNRAFVQSFLDGLSDRKGIQEQARKALRMLEKWAIKRNRLAGLITLETDIIGSDGAREPWTEPEIALAVAHCTEPMARVIQLCASTGQRLGDCTRMRWDDLHVERGRLGIYIVKMEKTKRPQWCPIIHEFEPILMAWPRDALTILRRPTGAPWSRIDLSNAWWQQRRKNASLAPLLARKLSLHGLRASAIIRLRRDGLSNAMIGAVVGMSEPIVNLYCRRADQIEDAIRAMEIRDAARVIYLPKKERDN
jgi:integrase